MMSKVKIQIEGNVTTRIKGEIVLDKYDAQQIGFEQGEEPETMMEMLDELGELNFNDLHEYLINSECTLKRV